MDSPNIGESTIMDDMVKEYLPEAFALIYVINSANAGGIQKDSVGLLKYFFNNSCEKKSFLRFYTRYRDCLWFRNKIFQVRIFIIFTRIPNDPFPFLTGEFGQNIIAKKALA